MEGLVKGDVVVLHYPYTDFSQFKRRPALVVAVLPGGQNVILCQITSQFKTDPDAVTITASDFANGGLTQPVSNVRPNHLVTIHRDRILYCVGALTAERLDFVIAAIVDISNALDKEPSRCPRAAPSCNPLGAFFTWDE